MPWSKELRAGGRAECQIRNAVANLPATSKGMRPGAVAAAQECDADPTDPQHIQRALYHISKGLTPFAIGLSIWVVQTLSEGPKCVTDDSHAILNFEQQAGQKRTCARLGTARCCCHGRKKDPI